MLALTISRLRFLLIKFLQRTVDSGDCGLRRACRHASDVLHLRENLACLNILLDALIQRRLPHRLLLEQIDHITVVEVSREDFLSLSQR